MCFGGLRRSEIVALDVGDVAPGLRLRRVQGKGGVETAVPLPKVAQDILAGYVATVRANARKRGGPACELFSWRSTTQPNRRACAIS